MINKNQVICAQFSGIVNVDGYDVTILKFKIELLKVYFTAYVRFDILQDDNYGYETYREKDVIGIDTLHGFNLNMNEDQKYKDTIYQISMIIKEHKKWIANGGN